MFWFTFRDDVSSFPFCFLCRMKWVGIGFGVEQCGRVLFVVRAALELRDNQRYGYLVAIKYYGTVFLKVIVTIKLIDLPDNFDGY